jgi:hypothetical protein
MEAPDRRRLIVASLEQQGFRVEDSRLLPPPQPSKDTLRQLHALAVRNRLEKARKGLQRHEAALLARFAAGPEVDPARIQPRLVEVRRRSPEELLFRYACLHWSIPVSSGYGRRLRFLVVDGHNGKLMGLFGLGDPVFSLAPRDRWVGWDQEGRRARLRHVVDAFVPGAVPPYSLLLGGKLLALPAASGEVREAFRQKYGGQSLPQPGKTSEGRVPLINLRLSGWPPAWSPAPGAVAPGRRPLPDVSPASRESSGRY